MALKPISGSPRDTLRFGSGTMALVLLGCRSVKSERSSDRTPVLISCSLTRSIVSTVISDEVGSQRIHTDIYLLKRQ